MYYIRSILFFLLLLKTPSLLADFTDEALNAQWIALQQSPLHMEAPRMMVFFSGTPGMGKTTIARYLEKELSGIRISNDESRMYLRAALGDETALDADIKLEDHIYRLLTLLDFNTDNHCLIMDYGIDGDGERPQKLARALGYDTFTIRLVAPKDVVVSRLKGRESDPSVHLERLDGWWEEYESLDPSIVDYRFDVSGDIGQLDLAALLGTIQGKIETIPRTDADLERMDPVTAGKLYAIAQKVDGLFQEHNLFYWAVSGTLLGIVRHEGLIPWDDDIDYSIYEEDIPKFHQLEPFLAAEGLSICECSGYYKIFDAEGTPIPIEGTEEHYPWKHPFIDIFPFSQKDGKVTYASERLREAMGAKDYFEPHQLVFPLEKAPFGPLCLPIPHDSELYLNRMYGIDWSRVAYAEYSHREEKVLKKVKVKMTNLNGPDYILP